MLQDPNQVAWANAVHLNFPNQKDRGSHINVSGAVIAKYAPHKTSAQALLEFLATAQAQNLYADLNMEYPVSPDAQPSALLNSWGTFKEDSLALEKIAQYRKQALKLIDKVHFDL
jgi:iron(III) transport system substrate-binding protein